jgi:hypothetical protein
MAEKGMALQSPALQCREHLASLGLGPSLIESNSQRLVFEESFSRLKFSGYQY